MYDFIIKNHTIFIHPLKKKKLISSEYVRTHRSHLSFALQYFSLDSANQSGNIIRYIYAFYRFSKS